MSFILSVSRRTNLVAAIFAHLKVTLQELFQDRRAIVFAISGPERRVDVCEVFSTPTAKMHRT